jgi:hypothetical protein
MTTAYTLLVVTILMGIGSALSVYFWGNPTPETEPSAAAPYVFNYWLSLIYSLVAVGAVFGLVGLFNRDGWERWLRLAFLNRYALLLAVVQIGLVPLALVVAPGLLRGLLAVGGPAQLFHLGWMSIVLALIPLLTAQVTEANADARYFNPTGAVPAATASPPVWPVVRWLTLLLLAIPLPATCVWVTMLDRGSSAWVHLPGLLAGLGLGLAVGVGLLFLGRVLEALLVPPAMRLDGLFPFGRLVQGVTYRPWLEPAFKALERVLVLFGIGYYTLPPVTPGEAPPKKRLAPGHAQITLTLAVGLLVYFGSYLFILLRGYGPDASSWFPAMFYLLLVLALAGLFFQGLAFWLDRYHLSPVLAVLLFSMLMYMLNRTDHFFDLQNDATEQPAPLFADVIKKLKLRQTKGPTEKSPRRTLVCVTAAGGGIQAAAWSTKVLGELHRHYGEDFTHSIGLISAVSGGSVGTMYYLDAFGDERGKFQPHAFDEDAHGRAMENSIRWNATASSLEATAWGVAYPDLLRTLFPPLASRLDDRGTRIELDWRRRLRPRDKPWQMGDLARAMEAGKMPVVVFNSTIAETGQRALLWPLLTRPRKEWPQNRKPAVRPMATEHRELPELYPNAQLPVTSAVRASATFSYVSPICRPLADAHTPEADCYHFCDGGYVDNEGLVTLVDLLDRFFTDEDLAEEEFFDRILIVRIQPFPTTGDAAPAKGDGGWLYSTTGPFDVLRQVRVASQAERNTKGVILFGQAVAWAYEAERVKDRFKQVELVFDPGPGKIVPLNWRLTDEQRDDINKRWTVLEKDPKGPLAEIDQWFTRKDKP